MLFVQVISLRNMTVKHFSIEYDAVNSENTFTNGDTINGRIIVEVSKQTKIQSLVFIAQAKARVCWREDHGNQQHIYWAEEEYYNIQEHIVRESRQDGTEVIDRGRHIFPFVFQIPDRNIPSSFNSPTGKIVHKVKAELKHSLKLMKSAKAYFLFTSKTDMNISGLMEPQQDSKDKTIKVFGSGTISMHVRTQRMGFSQGEALQVTVDILNHSSRSVKPRITLYEKQSFIAQRTRTVRPNVIQKEKLASVASSSRETVTRLISIPADLPPSILNSSIIKLEYRLKVHLNIKCASDLEVKVPVVVLPTLGVPRQPPPYSFEPEAYEIPNQEDWSATPQQAAFQPVDSPPSYKTYTLYPHPY
ncbi:arrestin domain-containing protein 3-like [Betta splendens]|uniref:Arrestin domain-containing protein 3-like n=1 Tax=Betta splendens TaxID=158456 RepID=A0A9W2Y217_BETSP|nr:arrestin domain-containing protein 3-like [Betta splendens]